MHYVGIFGNSASSWIDKGIQFRKKGDFEQSIIAFDHALEKDPTDHHIWLNKAHTYRLMKLYNNKLVCNKKAMELKPDDPRVKKLYAEALMLLKKYDEALEVLLEALTIDTNLADIWFTIAQVYRLQQKLELAIVMYAKALDLDPSFYKAWIGKGFSYIGQRKLDEALYCFENAYEFSVTDNNELKATIFSGFAYTFYYMGMQDQALQYIDELLSTTDDKANMWKLRSDIMKNKQRYNEAIISINKALALDPNNASYHMQKCQILLEFEQLEEFEQFHDVMSAKFPNNPATYAMKGKYHHIKNNFSQAKTSYLKAIEIDDSFVYAMDELASLTTLQGDFESTIEYYDKILAKDPDYPTTIYQKGKLMIGLKEYDTAITCFSKLITMGKMEFDSLICLGYIHFQLEDWKNSLKYYHRALDHDPLNKQIVFLIGLVNYYWYKEDQSRTLFGAIKFFKKAIELDPDYINALKTRGDILKDMGQYDLDLKDE